MSTCFDDHKGSCELFLRVGTEHPLKFGMNSVLGRGQYAEIENPGAKCLYKHQVAKVPVTSYEDAAPRLSYAQEPGQVRRGIEILGEELRTLGA